MDAIDLSKIEAVLRPHYKKWAKGDHMPGRVPVNPVGLVVGFLVCLVQEWSRPDLTGFLAKHPEWVRFLGFDRVPDESTWSKLLDRVPRESLEALFADLVNDLQRRRFVSLRVLAVDGSFLPACPWDTDAAWGYAARNPKKALPYGRYVEQDGKVLGYGYRLHAIVDADTETPLVFRVSRANTNDAAEWPALFAASKTTVDWNEVGWLAGDKGYDTGNVRGSFATYDVRVAIPAANTPKDLRHGGFHGVKARVYKKRTSVERFFAFVKRFFSLSRWGVVGFDRVQKWVALACIASLVVAWANHVHDRPVHSLKAFVRALR